MYNVQLETWTRKNDLPHGVRHAQGFVLGLNRYHVIGGQNIFDPAEGKVIREYDLEKDVWMEGAKLPYNIRTGFGLVYNKQ